MNFPIVHFGYSFLREYVKKNAFVFTSLSLEEFRNWLKLKIKNEQRDEGFCQRCFVRDLKKEHWEEYSQLEKEIRDAEIEYDQHENKQHIQKLENEIHGVDKAIEGLAKFVEKNPHDEERQAKLNSFKEKQVQLQKEYYILLENTSIKFKLEAAIKKLQELRSRIELDKYEKKLEDTFKKQGHKKSFAGTQFEDISGNIIKENIYPILLRRYGVNAQNLTLLSNVTLGCARAEIDYVVVEKLDEESPVKVWAIVEVKKNINDVPGGFEVRQENLHWFTGHAEGYDSELYRTKVFRKGHFDKLVSHEENGISFIFDQSSFAEFHLTEGYFLEKLFFITYEKPIVGLRSSEKSVLMYRVATDVYFDIDDDSYLEKMFAQFKEKFSTLQTIDVFRLYNQNEEFSNNICIVERQKNIEKDIRKDLAEQQEKLASFVIIPETDGFFPKVKNPVLSFDIQYDENEAHVAADLFLWPDEHVATFSGLFKIDVPYVPSFFCFREGPPLLALYHRIIQDYPIPKLLIVDGHGIAHPRCFGVACWLGIATGIPSIGCAKDTLIGYDGEDLKDESGSYVFMTHDSRNLGFVVRRIAEVNPVFASPGHLVTMEDTLKIVLELPGKYKVPDTLRRADRACREHCNNETGNWKELHLLPKAIPLWEIK